MRGSKHISHEAADDLAPDFEAKDNRDSDDDEVSTSSTPGNSSPGIQFHF